MRKHSSSDERLGVTELRVGCTSMGHIKAKTLLISGLEKSSAPHPLTVIRTGPVEYSNLIFNIIYSLYIQGYVH